MSVLVLGSLNLDIVARVAALPQPGETVMASRVDRLPGGKGANQAVAAAKAGAKVSLAGAVGRDDAGEAMLAAMASAGIDVTGVARRDDTPTGQAFISVSDTGENCIVVAGGANQTVGPAEVAGASLADVKVLLAQLETPCVAIETLFRRPDAASAIKLLNAAPAVLEARPLLALADVVLVNEVELAAFADLATVPHATADVIAAAHGLIGRAGQTVVVTLGHAGAVAVDGAGHELVVGRPAAVLDTTGAGDCFCGVLAARLADGLALPAALAWANAAASLSTEKPGATPAMPSFEEIAAVLEF